ncbi:uncharacterized protein B0T15DRAFT_398359 [Chaetomium strumarium]|uniref:Protein SQS1 n=1 Tax=Chaetomium strumarium TaxID=1170767 RepID=A0AAJ0M1F6_9PEZI|nr:hypothetical protein B0T15DRAFT_398359 [Chaetomium strumarium]
MPRKKEKWPSKRSKGSKARPAVSFGSLRDSISTTPTTRGPANGFSMRDEARNTASHHSSPWNSGDAKLRLKPVTFVSAGLAEPLEEDGLSVERSDADTTEDPVEDATSVIGDTAGVRNADSPEAEVVSVIKTKTSIENVVREHATVDLLVGKQLVGDGEEGAAGQGSETSSLFFFDLGQDGPVLDTLLPPPRIPTPRSASGDSITSEDVIVFRGRYAITQGVPRRNGASQSTARVSPLETPLEHDPDVNALFSQSESKRVASPIRSQRRGRNPQRRRSQPLEAMEDDEDDILADYIANVGADPDNGLIGSQFQVSSGYRDLGGDHQAVMFGLGEQTSPRSDESSDEESEQGAATGTSDAERDAFPDEDEDDGMDADMDDETFARRLAQQELGFWGDDLGALSSSFTRTETTKARGKRPANGGSSQAVPGRASAAQVADAFDNLDLTDLSQLSMHSRKRRSKQPPNFNVSDSEIEAALRTAWQRDRERKKSRKMQREALRAEGLLGKNANPDDLRVKYAAGMKLDDIKAELTLFLLSSAPRLDFPPLDKHARKVIHELASRFNIKSQSTGKGDNRWPVLYRTNRTVRYDSTQVEDVTTNVDQAALRIHRKYFHRVDVKGKRTEAPKATSGARSGHKAVTLREGEIVGASVPELGQENKGRTMLEKMGWSKGMGLGALDNKGILEPVAQVVKRSKAGLG